MNAHSPWSSQTLWCLLDLGQVLLVPSLSLVVHSSHAGALLLFKIFRWNIPDSCLMRVFRRDCLSHFWLHSWLSNENSCMPWKIRIVAQGPTNGVFPHHSIHKPDDLWEVNLCMCVCVHPYKFAHFRWNYLFLVSPRLSLLSLFPRLQRLIHMNIRRPLNAELSWKLLCTFIAY